MLLGAHTRTGPFCCLTRWYTMVADVTVLPVPGGPYGQDIHRQQYLAPLWVGKVQSNHPNIESMKWHQNGSTSATTSGGCAPKCAKQYAPTSMSNLSADSRLLFCSLFSKFSATVKTARVDCHAHYLMWTPIKTMSMIGRRQNNTLSPNHSSKIQ